MAKPDWEAIELAYRAGVLSIRELVGKYSISHQALSKRAKKDDWERDLKAKVQAKADALVAKRKVATDSHISERQLIEATAEVIATVRMGHRGDIHRARELTNKLFDVLAGECGDVADLEDLGEIVRSLTYQWKKLAAPRIARYYACRATASLSACCYVIPSPCPFEPVHKFV